MPKSRRTERTDEGRQPGGIGEVADQVTVAAQGVARVARAAIASAKTVLESRVEEGKEVAVALQDAAGRLTGSPGARRLVRKAKKAVTGAKAVAARATKKTARKAKAKKVASKAKKVARTAKKVARTATKVARKATKPTTKAKRVARKVKRKAVATARSPKAGKRRRA